ncbi:MAG TPA: methyl-accepting chemotaxis protein, partial [Thermomonas sp.]|nr:methyl-accepting chemotaxis protein [Thermomonas sp.]
MDSVAGKGRNISTNFWIWLLIGSLLVFAGNTLYATTKASRLGGASTAASRLQLNSQRLANQGREAIEGNAQAFDAFKATKGEVDEDIKTLNDRFGDQAGVSGPIRTVSNTWDPLAKRADEVMASQQAVLALAGRADSFSAKVPQLQAQLNEVVRGLASGGAGSGQVFTALQQVVTTGNMARRIAELRAGGSGAQVAADALGRDSAVFDRSMNALRNGSGDIAKVTAAGAVAPLNQAATLWAGMKKDLDGIVGDSKKLIGAQASATALANGSDKLLSDSESLFAAFTSFGSLKDTSIVGGVWVSILSGLLMLFSIGGLVWAQGRAQRLRYHTTKELNDRNQEAIMRLLDEMGSLAEGDLTVKATVTEDMTGAIADSINFAVEQLRTLVATINDTSVQVASSAQETQATAMHLADAAEHQAQEINTATDRINEIASSINQVSRNSADSAEVARRSVQIATNGAGVVRQTIAGMDSIRDQIQETSKRIKRLGESSQ